MPFDFQNSGLVSRNGKHTSLHSEHAVYSSSKRDFNYHPKTSLQRMEKLFLMVLSWIGLGSYIAGIWLNIGNWKSLILFALGVAFMVAKLVRYIVKTYQEYRREEIEIEILRKKSGE